MIQGRNTLYSKRARCSAPQVGKLHQISPKPSAPPPSARTITAGRLVMAPNAVLT